MQKRKRGFTLIEMLVVVVVIGILAMAVMPKFNKVFATRQTTEAEEMLLAIRQEQVMRCAQEESYEVDDISNLGISETLNEGQSKYFAYGVGDEGAFAASASIKNLVLRIPYYELGKICCDGSACDTLNKNYPTCDELATEYDSNADLKNYEEACYPGS